MYSPEGQRRHGEMAVSCGGFYLDRSFWDTHHPIKVEVGFGP